MGAKYDEFLDKKMAELSVAMTEKPVGENSKLINAKNRPILLSDLKAEDLKKSWIWEGYIAKGFISLLTAPPKVGKSEFIRGLLKSIEEEIEFIGQPTSKVNVLVISEESVIDWVEKRDEFDFTSKNKVWIWSKPFLVKIKLKVWETFFEEVLDFCKENNIDFIIMDTISKYWPVDNENDASQMTDALRPTYLWTKNNLAVLIVHHDNKHGGSFGNNIRGSSAIAGFTDMNISYGRLEGSNEADRKRTLKSSGRFSNAEDTIVIEWQDDLTYRFIGDKYSVSKSGRIEVIIGIFRNNLASLSVADVKNKWDTTRFGTPPSLRTIQRYITELAYKNELVFIEERILTTKKVPFYALAGTYSEQQELLTTKPVSLASPLSSPNGIQSYSRSRHDSGETGKEILSSPTINDEKNIEWDPRI